MSHTTCIKGIYNPNIAQEACFWQLVPDYDDPSGFVLRLVHADGSFVCNVLGVCDGELYRDTLPEHKISAFNLKTNADRRLATAAERGDKEIS